VPLDTPFPQNFWLTGLKTPKSRATGHWTFTDEIFKLTALLNMQVVAKQLTSLPETNEAGKSRFAGRAVSN